MIIQAVSVNVVNFIAFRLFAKPTFSNYFVNIDFVNFTFDRDVKTPILSVAVVLMLVTF